MRARSRAAEGQGSVGARRTEHHVVPVRHPDTPATTSARRGSGLGVCCVRLGGLPRIHRLRAFGGPGHLDRRGAMGSDIDADYASGLTF